MSQNKPSSISHSNRSWTKSFEFYKKKRSSAVHFKIFTIEKYRWLEKSPKYFKKSNILINFDIVVFPLALLAE